MRTPALAELSDADLLARVHVLACDERRATAALVAHLAEIENRKLYLSQACASLFVYCTRVLHLSEHAAYNRIEAARVARRFPAVLASLEAGRLHLTAIRLLAPILTDENHRDVLAQATHKSKREVEELLARLRPQADVAAQVRKLPASKPGSGVPGAAGGREIQPGTSVPTSTPDMNAGPAVQDAAAAPAPQGAPAVAAPQGVPAAPSATPPARPAVVMPLAPERYKVQVTVGAATHDKLRRAQELLRHRIPDGDIAQVIDLALDLLVHDLEKRKFAAGRQPRPRAPRQAPARPAPPSPGPPASRPSRHVPADVKRRVWERDRGRCAFVSPAGDRCGERGGLEFDHVRPHADGGGATLDNVRLLCRRHNQYEAQQFFGPWQSDVPGEISTRSGTS